MNVTEIIGKSYRITNTDESTFLDGIGANVLADLNNCFKHRVLKISKIRQDINPLITEQRTDLKSVDTLVEGDIGFNGEYPFSLDTLRPIRVEVSYDGVTYKKAKTYDLNDNNNSEFSQLDIQSEFHEAEPFVRFERDSYFVRPLKTVAGDIVNGIHLWWEKRPSDLVTDGPDSIDVSLHDVLSFDLCRLEVLMHPDKYSQTWRIDFEREAARIEALFEDFYKNRMKRTLRFNPSNINFK